MVLICHIWLNSLALSFKFQLSNLEAFFGKLILKVANQTVEIPFNFQSLLAHCLFQNFYLSDSKEIKITTPFQSTEIEVSSIVDAKSLPVGDNEKFFKEFATKKSKVDEIRNAAEKENSLRGRELIQEQKNSSLGKNGLNDFQVAYIYSNGVMGRRGNWKKCYLYEGQV